MFSGLLNGKRVLWGHLGICNAQALAAGGYEGEVDHIGASGDPADVLWFPCDGLCFAGPLEGEILDPMVRLQCTWGEWKRLHPNTRVLALPKDPKHSDARGGHGAEEYFERPGIDEIFLQSMIGEPDRRLPESATVLGVNVPQGLRAYPLEEVKREGGVVNDVLEDLALVVLCGPEPDSIKASVWRRDLDGRRLHFEIRGGAFRDRETDSAWSIFGEALEGPLRGSQLEPVATHITRWHSWCYTHAGSEVWKSRRSHAPEGSIDPGVFGPALDAWRREGHEVAIVRAVYNLERPLESDFGLVLRVGGDRLKLHHFETTTAADDYVWLKPRSARLGRVVLESEPEAEARFTDVAIQRELRPDDEIPWSPLVTDQAFLTPLASVAPSEDPAPGFRVLAEGLRAGGIPVELGFDTPMNQDVPTQCLSPMLSGIARYPGVRNGLWVALGEQKDPFCILRFEKSEDARHFAEWAKHTLTVGSYAFRSVPIDMFVHPRFGMIDRPDDKVDWSPLATDEKFRERVADILGVI